MTIGKAFKRQIKDGEPVTPEGLLERKKTKYHNKEKVEAGHIVLHVFVEYNNTSSELTIIGSHQLDLYELDESYNIPKNSYTIPYIKLKDNKS